MNAADALRAIRGLAVANRYIITEHAWQRARQRGVSVPDIHHALTTAAACAWQAEHRTWRVDGEDCDGDALTVAVAIQSDLIVVTVF